MGVYNQESEIPDNSAELLLGVANIRHRKIADTSLDVHLGVSNIRHRQSQIPVSTCLWVHQAPQIATTVADLPLGASKIKHPKVADTICDLP